MTAEAFVLENGSHLLLVAFGSRRQLWLSHQRATKHEEQWQISKAGRYPEHLVLPRLSRWLN